MRDFWRELGYAPCTVKPRRLLANPESYRSKSGPNGHALLTAIQDSKYLPDSLIKSIINVGGPRLGLLIRNSKSEITSSIYQKFFKISDRQSIRRLSWFKDKEAKIRTIGILDWYSQLALKPLHQYLADVSKD
jgi:hypothetical protein